MKVDFVYSYPYDRIFCELLKVKQREKEVERFIKKLKKKRIFILKAAKKIEEITGLKFKKDVKCYVVSDTLWKGFSDPLTIRATSINEFISVLIHELIHIISVQNKEKMERLNKLRDKKFKLPKHIRVHIWVYIVEKKVKRIIKFKDNPKQRTNIKKRYKNDLIKGYKKAREVANQLEKELPNKNLVKEFEKYLNKNL